MLNGLAHVIDVLLVEFDIDTADQSIERVVELHEVKAEVERNLELLDEATHLAPQLPLSQLFLLYVFEEGLTFFFAYDVSFPFCIVEQASERAQIEVDAPADFPFFTDLDFLDYQVHDQVFEEVRVQNAFRLLVVLTPRVYKCI